MHHIEGGMAMLCPATVPAPFTAQKAVNLEFLSSVEFVQFHGVKFSYMCLFGFKTGMHCDRLLAALFSCGDLCIYKYRIWKGGSWVIEKQSTSKKVLKL